MRYQGSKRSIIKDLKVLIEKNLGKCKYYVEPFGGGMNSFAYIFHPNKIALDINPYVIAMWKGIQNHTFKIPEKLTEQEYYEMKADCLSNGGKYDMATLGYVGNACSNGCGW
jgi:site-specific DNA-adenine methylase